MSTESLPLTPIFFDGLVHRSEAARHLGAVLVRELAGKRDEVFLFRNHVIGHSAITLPTVCAPVFFAGAGDHVAAPAVIANSAAGNVINDHPVAHSKTTTAGANLHDLTAGLMAGNHSLITFGPFPKVLMVDATDVGTADSGGLHPKQNFAVPGARRRQSAEIHPAIAGKKRSSHALFHALPVRGIPTRGLQPGSGRGYFPIQVPEVFPGLSVLPEKHLPFDQPAVAVDGADFIHFLCG